jgi:Uma2 family endonuclease
MSVRPPARSNEQHFRFSSIDWPTYVAMGKLLQDRPIRMNYDRGELELMTTTAAHQRLKCVIRRLLQTLTEELDIGIVGCGSMTFQREDLEKGIEPDKCWWIQNESAIRGKFDIHLDVDPPPDLVVEIEVSRSILNRLRILAALGVKEVWRCDGEALHVMVLNHAGEYVETLHSLAVPFFFLMQELMRYSGMRYELSDTALNQCFRTWVREQIAAGCPSSDTSTSDSTPNP